MVPPQPERRLGQGVEVLTTKGPASFGGGEQVEGLLPAAPPHGGPGRAQDGLHRLPVRHLFHRCEWHRDRQLRRALEAPGGSSSRSCRRIAAWSRPTAGLGRVLTYE
jgi:hypothetical protein